MIIIFTIIFHGGLTLTFRNDGLIACLFVLTFSSIGSVALNRKTLLRETTFEKKIRLKEYQTYISSILYKTKL